MTASQLLDAQVQEKRRYALLSELFDLTKQLAEAVDRDDEIATRMLLSMRGNRWKKCGRWRKT